MDSSGLFSSSYLRLGAIGILLACGACGGSSHHGHADAGMGVAESQAVQPLSANDVSMLFPAPTNPADLNKLIAVSDITSPNSQDPTKRDPVWPAAAFQQFVAIADGAFSQVAGTQDRIGLPADAQNVGSWFIAGIRIDAGAPGLSSDIRGQFGQLPEIRLIIQPVTRNLDGTPNVHDIAGHLIFDFTLENPNELAQADCSQRPRPKSDPEAFNAIVTDIAALRTKLSNGQLGAHKVTTSGVPLGVHPGLADATTA